MRPLSDYQRNYASQFGEDGIIEEILKRLEDSPSVEKWCAEFGAWDGMHLSNTYNLISRHGYKSVLIEGDKNKYAELCQNIPSNDAYKICAFVELDGEQSLDNLLKTTPIPHDFDLLSIDIDGCDYYILENLRAYKPKVICIEFNPTIPNEVNFVQPKDFSVKWGSSAKAITKLARSKGYTLAAVTYANLLFVREEFSEKVIGGQPTNLESLRDDTDCRIFVFVGFDGTVLSNSDSLHLAWHGLSVDTNSFQLLPSYLRKFKEDYNLSRKIAFRLFVRFLRIKKSAAKLTKYLFK